MPALLLRPRAPSAGPGLGPLCWDRAGGELRGHPSGTATGPQDRGQRGACAGNEAVRSGDARFQRGQEGQGELLTCVRAPGVQRTPRAGGRGRRGALQGRPRGPRSCVPGRLRPGLAPRTLESGSAPRTRELVTGTGWWHRLVHASAVTAGTTVVPPCGLARGSGSGARARLSAGGSRTEPNLCDRGQRGVRTRAVAPRRSWECP